MPQRVVWAGTQVGWTAPEDRGVEGIGRQLVIWVAAWLAGTAAFGADDLTRLSDEFDDAGSLGGWSRVQAVEGWNADQMESWDVNETRAGYMTLTPRASSWYNNWRGILAFKRVSGDFVATIEVEPRNRAGTGPPNANYSLAGIMARAPRDGLSQPGDWTPGGENYIFLSAGTANSPGSYQFEVKTTVNSQSTLEISPGAARVTIQIARIGTVFLALRRLGDGPWEVHRRYLRTDLPPELQVGLTVYTDWDTVSQMDPFEHNRTVISGGNPDLTVSVDYFRYVRPAVPEALAGLDFMNEGAVSDTDLISFLGDAANQAPAAQEAEEVALLNVGYELETASLRIVASSTPGQAYGVYRSGDLHEWELVESLEAEGGSLEVRVPALESGETFVRVSVEE